MRLNLGMSILCMMEACAAESLRTEKKKEENVGAKKSRTLHVFFDLIIFSILSKFIDGH
jgi:hypothetical protein